MLNSSNRDKRVLTDEHKTNMRKNDGKSSGGRWGKEMKGSEVWMGNFTLRFMDIDETVRVKLTLAAVII